MAETQGATSNERLLAAAKTDNVELLQEVFEQSDSDFDINFQDGLGNTALHYAVSRCSSDVLEHILAHENCDVDPINRIEKATPLHLAVNIEDPEFRKYFVESLLDAGADTYIKDKNGDMAIYLVNPADKETLAFFRKARALAAISADDIVSDDDAAPGSGSDED